MTPRQMATLTMGTVFAMMWLCFGAGIATYLVTLEDASLGWKLTVGAFSGMIYSAATYGGIIVAIEEYEKTTPQVRKPVSDPALEAMREVQREESHRLRRQREEIRRLEDKVSALSYERNKWKQHAHDREHAARDNGGFMANPPLLGPGSTPYVPDDTNRA